jgi:hypothetical protein
MTLVEAMAEASRMGNPSGRGRDEQARREIAEQTMLTGEEPLAPLNPKPKTLKP